MAVYFLTRNSGDLLKKFGDAIDQEEAKGKIETWQKYEFNGKTYYTHTSKNWHKKAYFSAEKDKEYLKFNIVAPQGVTLSKTVYAYYHGHLAETMTAHFSNSFTHASISANAEDGDVMKGSEPAKK